MPRQHLPNDYQPVIRSRRKNATDQGNAQDGRGPNVATSHRGKGDGEISKRSATRRMLSLVSGKTSQATFLKPGHVFSFAALFMFTAILYARPAEFYPSPLTASIALIVALATIGFFIPTQLSLEGNLTARPREVHLVLLFTLTGLLSVPLAINPGIGWQEFSGTFIRCVVIFIVMINVIRTESRLKALMFLGLAACIWLSAEALNDYRQGLMTVEGYRASGRGTGIFGNTNDMALHLVTMLPISIALLFGSKGVGRKIFYGVCSALAIAAIVLSYSRGAFLGLVVVLIYFTIKLGGRHRIEILLAIFGVGIVLMLLAPSGYGGRLLSIFMPSLDPAGSADARRGELFRSIYIALRHPLLGIGMGNYQPEMSYRGLVTHNSYTQVAAEAGMLALVSYLMFIISPLRKLGQIARETLAARRDSSFYYLAIGLQASLIAYMVSSFFLSVAFNWYVFYLVGYAVCLRRLYESETGKSVVVETRKERKESRLADGSLVNESKAVLT
jgi:putative inorganic carbon (hco3(-)) transporter